MTDEPDAQTALSDVLADLYSTRESASRVVSDAGIDPRNTTWSSTPRNL